MGAVSEEHSFLLGLAGADIVSPQTLAKGHLSDKHVTCSGKIKAGVISAVAMSIATRTSTDEQGADEHGKCKAAEAAGAHKADQEELECANSLPDFVDLLSAKAAAVHMHLQCSSASCTQAWNARGEKALDWLQWRQGLPCS